MFATQDIPAGELILSESPLFCVTGNNRRTLQKFAGTAPDDARAELSEADRKTFWDLHDRHGGSKTALGIFKTNALPLGLTTEDGAIFPLCSRINHSCCPNVNHSWNPTTKRESIYAIRHIKEGEEIFTTYNASFYQTRDERRVTLQTSFNFFCECSLCTLPDLERKKSDAERKEMKKLDDEILFCVQMTRTNQALEKVHLLLKKLDEAGIPHKASTYYDAFQACCVAKNVAGAKKWAKLAYDNYVLTEGQESDNTLRMWRYYQNPQSHRLWNTF
jgi:hypothetical protein